MVIKKVVIDKANRLYQLPPDILSFSREKVRRTLIKKTSLVDLARFNWPIEVEADTLRDKNGFRPAGRDRINQLKELLADWFLTHHRVKVNPQKEIFIGGRISSIMFGIALAFVDNGDIIFVPDLGIPLYRRVTTACGGQPVGYAVTYKNGWQPDFERINTRLGRVARLLFVNSPHNPTGVALTEKDWANLVWIAARENIVLVNDAAYQSISHRAPTSLMAVKGGKKVGLEVYSFAYQFGLPAIPVGFAVGSGDIISGLELSAGFMPPFIPDFYIDMASTAIRQFPHDSLLRVRKQLGQAAAEAVKLLELLSLEKTGYDTIPFVWAKIERRRQATSQARLLYRRSRVLTAPGTGFGDSGEGFLRFSLTASPRDYRSAHERLMRKLRLIGMGGG